MPSLKQVNVAFSPGLIDVMTFYINNLEQLTCSLMFLVEYNKMIVFIHDNGGRVFTTILHCFIILLSGIYDTIKTCSRWKLDTVVKAVHGGLAATPI